MPQPRIEIPKDKLGEFCQRHHIVRLSLFGSVLRDDFGPASDIDVLVEFDPKYIPGLMRLVGIEMELSKILGGRKVDMRTAEDISRYFRKKVLTEAQNQYVRP